jgi:protein TonB
MTGATEPISGKPWTKRAVSGAVGEGRTRFGLASVVLHALVLAALAVFVRSATVPDLADETPIEMVFAAAAAEPAPPEPAQPEPVVDAAPELPQRQPGPEPTVQPPPTPAPKPKPVRVARAAPSVAPTVAPPSPAMAPTLPTPADAPAVDPAWQSAVVAWLASHKTYPEDSRRRGEEGRVAVRFTVDRSGRVLEADIAGSSGVQRLDDAVAAMMREAALPRFPASMTRERITITTTVRYTLR